MFGRTVKVGDRTVFVFCTPQEPLSSVLRRAANIIEREDREAINETIAAYHKAVNS